MFEATHMYLWFMKQIVTKEELRKVESRSGKGIVQFGWLNLNFVCKWGPCTSHTDVLQHYVQWQQLCLTMQYLESPPFLWGINWSSFVPARHLLTLGQWIVFRMKFLRYLLAFFLWISHKCARRTNLCGESSIRQLFPSRCEKLKPDRGWSNLCKAGKGSKGLPTIFVHHLFHGHGTTMHSKRDHAVLCIAGQEWGKFLVGFSFRVEDFFSIECQRKPLHPSWSHINCVPWAVGEKLSCCSNENRPTSVGRRWRSDWRQNIWGDQREHTQRKKLDGKDSSWSFWMAQCTMWLST